MKYTVPYSNVGKGGLLHINGKHYHTPSWTEVLPTTTLDDIVIEAKPFAELFEDTKQEEQWKFISARTGEEYIVRYNIKNELSCSCWGYISHKNCKHIKEVKNG